MSRQLNKATVESERQPTLSLTKSTRKSVVDSFFQSSQQRPDYKFGSAFISKSTSSFGNEAEKDCYKKPSQKASKNEEAAEVARVLSNEEEKEMTCHLENSTYLSISKGLVNGLNKPKSQMSENVKDSKSMSIVEEACRKQLLQNHLSVIEAMELLELNADQEIVKQAMDQLFQLDIVRPPSEIEVWMRPLTDEETEKLFEKLAKYIGENIKLLLENEDRNYCFRLHRDRVYYAEEHLMRTAAVVGRKDLVSFGTCLGKFTKGGKFFLHITALEYLAPYAKSKIWLKPSAEQQFTFGNNILKSGVARITEGVEQRQGVVVYSIDDKPLGFGVTAKGTAECRRSDPTALIVLHQADLGEYIRNEDNLT